MTIYSYSRITTFEKCPLKFKFRYIDRLKPEIKQFIEGFLGNQVHKTLEWIYKQINIKESLKLDQVIEYFAKEWTQNFNKEIKIIKKEHTSEDYFNQGIKFLIDYFFRHSPFKDNTIATEKRIFFKLDIEGKYKLQGYIDRIVHHKDKGIYEIHDYKTSSFLKTQEELDKDEQLALYGLAIKNNFENVKEILLVWHFLAFNEIRISKRTEVQFEELKKQIINKINKIEAAKNFEPNPSPLCKWCEFKSYCPLFKKIK